MANIGQLVIDVAMQTARFNQAAQEINGRLGRMERNFSTSFRNIERGATRFLGVVTALAGAGGLGALAAQAVKTADNIGKTADKIGVGVEALQEWRFAAEQSGLQARQVDLAIQRFGRRLGEAAEFGQGELLPALKKLNIEFKNNDGSVKSIDSVLTEFLGKLGQISDVSIRNALAMKAFDTEGVAMVNIAAKGAAELEKLKQSARDLGIVLSEDTVRNAERMNDEFNAASQILKTQFQQVLLDLAPLVIEFAKGLGLIVSNLRNLGKEMGILSSTRAEQLNVQIKEVTNRINELADFLYINKEGSWIEKFKTGALDPFGFSVAAAREELEKLRDQLKQLLREREGLLAPGPQKPGGPATTIAPPIFTSQGYPSARQAEEASNEALRIFEMGEEAKLAAARETALAQLQVLQDRLLTEEDMIRKAAERDIAEKEKLFELERLSFDEFNAYRVAKQIEAEEAITEVSKRESMKRIALEQTVANAKSALARGVVSESINLLNALSAKSKGAALAAIALQKGVAIAETFMATQAAIMKAYEIYGPTPAGHAAATAMGILGGIKIGLIAATGFAQAGSVGDTGAGLGSVTNPVFTQNTAFDTGGFNTSTQPTNVNITLQGRSFDRDQVLELIDAINDALGDGANIAVTQ